MSFQFLNKSHTCYRLYRALSFHNIQHTIKTPPFLFNITIYTCSVTSEKRPAFTVDFTIVTKENEHVKCRARHGQTLLDVCLDYELEVEGACGGECCCSTCHLHLTSEMFEQLKEPNEDELDMLDLAVDVCPTSRLGCQISVEEILHGTVFHLPAETINQMPDEKND